MKLRLIVADPAGNRTILVRTQVPKEQRADISRVLLQNHRLRGEQVGFLTEPRSDAAGRLEMMGGEFCGNAARSVGYLLSRDRGRGETKVRIEISGAEHPLTVQVDPIRGRAAAEMPVPRDIVSLDVPGMKPVPLVRMDGIEHAIVEGVPPRPETAQRILTAAVEQYPCDAIGVMFLNGDEMIPVVLVAATESTVWESSCGSGSMACGFYLSREMRDGHFSCVLKQPGGSIEAVVERQNGTVIRCSIGGPVTLESELEIEM